MNFVGDRNVTPEAIPPARKARVWVWPAAVVALLVFQVAVCGTVIFFSNSDPAFAVEPNYYRKAVAWDEHAARQRASKALGWTAALVVSTVADVRGEREVMLLLRDQDGAPLNTARASAECFHRARGRDRIELQFEETGEGRYVAKTQLRLAGETFGQA